MTEIKEKKGTKMEKEVKMDFETKASHNGIYIE